MGIRTKLFLFALVAIVVMGLASGAYLQKQLRVAYEHRLEGDLEEKALMTAAALSAFESQGSEGDRQHSSESALDDWVDGLAQGAHVRISIIAPGGRVRADSRLDGDALAQVENHRARPEVRSAQQGKVGLSRRYSTTVGKNMIYVAVATAPGAPVVRVAMSTDEVDAAAAQLRVILFAAAGLGLLIASAVGALASYFATRTLRSLVESAQGVSRGGPDRLRYSAADELGVLAGSFNHLADELQNSVVSLREERDRLETILRGTSEGVLALDADRRIRLVNTAAMRLLDLPANIQGLPIVEVSREPGLLSLAEKGINEPFSAELTTGDPQRVLLGSADPLKATGGTVLVLHDVTEMRRLETIRKDFVANVSHELRTPVSVIQANSETLLDGALEDKEARRAFVEAIARNSERLGRLISDLLDLARIEAGSQDINREEVSVQRSVERAFSVMQRHAKEKDISLHIDVEPTMSVFADDKALDQILVNYIENAIKYSQAGASISVTAQMHEDLCRIVVEDDGPGIPMASRERVFERFYRVDPGRSRQVGGTGLGLSIVKHLAQIMGGQVGVHARIPQGSRFWISLPRA